MQCENGRNRIFFSFKTTAGHHLIEDVRKYKFRMAAISDDIILFSMTFIIVGTVSLLLPSNIPIHPRIGVFKDHDSTTRI